MDVSEQFYRGLKSYESSLFFKLLLGFLDKKLNNFDRQVYEWNVFRIPLFVLHDVIVQIVNDYVHDKRHLIVHVLFWNTLKALSELTSPFLWDVQSLLIVLCWFQILVKKTLKLFALRFFTKALLRYRRNEPVHILRYFVFLFINFRRCATRALHFLASSYYLILINLNFKIKIKVINRLFTDTWRQR
jgi:hypothetical protein